jgi:hypothetical protein
MKIAQGKRGTSAALGEQQKQKPLPLSRFGAPLGAPNLDKGRLSGGVVYPGRQSLRSFALGYFLLPLRGTGEGHRTLTPANQRAARNPSMTARCHGEGELRRFVDWNRYNPVQFVLS